MSRRKLTIRYRRTRFESDKEIISRKARRERKEDFGFVLDYWREMWYIIKK